MSAPHSYCCTPAPSQTCAFPVKVDYMPPRLAKCSFCEPGFYYLYQYDVYHLCANCLHTLLGFEQCEGYTYDAENECRLRCQRFVVTLNQ